MTIASVSLHNFLEVANPVRLPNDLENALCSEGPHFHNECTIVISGMRDIRNICLKMEYCSPIEQTHLTMSKFQPIIGMKVLDSLGSENPIERSSSDHSKLFRLLLSMVN